MALLEASGIGKNFGETHVLKDISLDLEQGEALAIIGSSGSGKTTLLRCLNFLERPDTGVIKVNGETMWDAADPATQKESEIRKKRLHFGLVFQNFNLFPQYTALQNVMLAGELLAKERPEYQANKKAIHAELEQQARELLAQMGLSERAGHYPHQLSGGQQQRVAIARALALLPDILCFDEPTSALDPELTGEVLKVLRDLADRKTTMIIVTHEMHFARDVADRILFMDGGVVVEEGPAKQLIDHPREERTRQFLAHYSECRDARRGGFISCTLWVSFGILIKTGGRKNDSSTETSTCKRSCIGPDGGAGDLRAGKERLPALSGWKNRHCNPCKRSIETSEKAGAVPEVTNVLYHRSGSGRLLSGNDSPGQ